uniref:Uncharacterized protein n=1 Tax=Fusarium oxysporum (strain Fo5176) TaxID=660025 RepID=A0A0D2YHW0_FUSOF
MHIEIREAKAVGVEHEAAEEEYQQNENEQRRPSIRTRTALLVEDVWVSMTGEAAGTYSQPRKPKMGAQPSDTTINKRPSQERYWFGGGSQTIVQK